MYRPPCIRCKETKDKGSMYSVILPREKNETHSRGAFMCASCWAQKLKEES